MYINIVEKVNLTLILGANDTRLNISLKQKSYDEIQISFSPFSVSTQPRRGLFFVLFLASLSLNTLISECEDGIDEEHRPVDDGQRTLGDGQSAPLGLEAAFPGLQDQHAGRDEHGASQQAEEQVDLLVDRVSEEMTCD